MPVRATKRGAQRTPLEGDADVLVCGASFAGLAVARELRGAGARVLVVDRYEIGERQTSACAAPTDWLRNLGLEGAIRQTFDSLVVHTPGARARWPLPWTFSTFDYRELCSLLWAQCGEAEFETATVSNVARSGAEGVAEGETLTIPTTARAPVGGVSPSTTPSAPFPATVHTDRGSLRAPLVIDALGWRRVLGGGPAIQPPEAYLSRGLEVHPAGRGEDLELWIDRRVIRAGYGWSFPARDELRVGVGSFDPRDHVKQPTVELAERLDLPPDGYQGNWIPHKLRPATEDGVFFVGDSAGHCLPLTAEGIRTALYFGIACGRELRAVLAGRRRHADALARYHAFSASHAWKFALLLRWQDAIPRLHPRGVQALTRALARPRASHWGFRHYLDVAPPQFALPAPPAATRARARARAAA